MPTPSQPARAPLSVRIMGTPRPVGAVVGLAFMGLGLWGLSDGSLFPSTAQIVLGAAMFGWHGYQLLRARRTAPAAATPTAATTPPA